MNTRDSIADIWGSRMPFSGEDNWPERVDARTLEEPEYWVQSACPLCSNGCACDIGVRNGRIVGVRGRAVDIVNRGRLGPKGLHGWEANNSRDRLTWPLIRQNGKLIPATWDEAMDLIVAKAREVRERYTASAIGFYTSGQLFLEEYYTLSVIGKAGLGTPHMDGNTRLCTATSAAALKETFGSDGQAGTYADLDVTDCILMVGHNMSRTDTVLWSRVLDRRCHSSPPALIVIDPRCTHTAKEADVHLAPRIGTNVAVLNGLLHLLIAGGHVDEAFIQQHTLGYDELAKVVLEYTPERVEKLSGVPAADLKKAVELIARSSMLVSTCLQGVYQSNQATAAAVQVNNINLILGRIGKPGCGLLQMNGQPTAQNTRESGADGDLPGFRNWDNPKHIEQLAEIWNVDPAIIPHWSPPTHALQIFRYCEIGSIRFLWIQATNPAVSLPNLNRIRQILQRAGLFVIVQDAFLTETAQFADVVLPAALWGEKTGCFTNVDRTVHISHKAVEPPGEARADLDIFLDFARRMDFRDKEDNPLIKWKTPEEAFEAWKRCSKGRPCDYSGLSYAKLSEGSGIPWPCNDQHPDGERRLYTSQIFSTEPDYCETYGHDLITGGAVSPEQYRAMNPAGRAILKPAEYYPLPEAPDAEYPFLLTTGRLVYQFHTRTKTGRSQSLANAAPDDFVQISAIDAEKFDIHENDWLRLTSRRGQIEAPARIGDIGPGELFVPFHYGYWDNPGRARAANELTIYEWDPVSKEPHYKYAAVRLEKVASPNLPQPEIMSHADTIASGAQGEEPQAPPAPAAYIAVYIGILQESERRLVKEFNQLAQTHENEPDIGTLSRLFASWSENAAQALQPFFERYDKSLIGELQHLDDAPLLPRKQGSFHLLRHLHDLWLMVNESLISIDVLDQAAKALRNSQLEETLSHIRQQNQRQSVWLRTRIRQAAPQTLIVPL